MLRLAIKLLMLVSVSTGCAGPELPEPTLPGRVVLFRGAGELFSNGLNALAYEVRRQGVKAQVVSSLADVELATEDRPIVLGGHSVGADAAITEAARLADTNTPVALLVLLDPYSPPPVPPNVRRVHLITGRATELRAARSTTTTTHRLQSDMPVVGFLFNQIGHVNMTSRRDVQRSALEVILRVYGRPLPPEWK